MENGWTVVKAVPDTGAQVSVAGAEIATGYKTRPTAASKAGKGFISASKHTIPSLGEVDLPAQSLEGVWSRQRWQIAPEGTLSKPLLSIGEECDRDQFVVFSAKGGAVVNQSTGMVRKFPRLQNGTYEMEMWIPPIDAIERVAPGFTRQGP